MKSFIISIILPILLALQSYAGIQDGLVIYFSFDKFDGKTVINTVNPKLNGILEADAKIVEGFKGKGVGLNVNADVHTPGTDFVRVANAPEVNIDKEFTIALYAKATNFGAYRTLISKTDAGAYAFTVEDAKLAGWVHVSGDYLHIMGKTVLEKDKWYHLAMTFNGNDGILYIDGNQDGKASKKGNITVNSSDFMIGAEPSGKNIDQTYPAWHGILDEFYFYNRALSEDEIRLIIKQVSTVKPHQKIASTWGRIKSD